MNAIPMFGISDEGADILNGPEIRRSNCDRATGVLSILKQSKLEGNRAVPCTNSIDESQK